jgi:hypothetical protein
MTTASKLVDEITGEEIVLEYDDSDPMYCNGPVVTAALDVGFPTPRSVGYNKPNTNGYVDLTQFWGDRTVAWAGYVRPVASDPYPAVVWDKIKALAAPDRRPWLHYIEDGWTSWRRIQLRGDSVAAPLTREWGPVISGQIQWRAANGGAQESAEPRIQNINPSGQSTGGVCIDETGFCFDDSCGPYFTEGYIGATTIVWNFGNVVAYPTIVFTGAVADPSIGNLTTNQFIKLRGPIGDNVDIWVDTDAKTIRESNDPSLSRLNMYDFTESDWLYLVPGINRIDYRFTPTDAGECTMRIYDRWI